MGLVCVFLRDKRPAGTVDIVHERESLRQSEEKWFEGFK